MVSKLFVDSDVLLDLFLERKPFYPFASALVNFVSHEDIPLYTTSLIVNNLYYFIAKNKNKNAAKDSIRLLLELAIVLPVTQQAVEESVNSNFGDFEDALQYYTALVNNCDIIITRNIKDYKKSTIPVLTAEQFLRTVLT